MTMEAAALLKFYTDLSTLVASGNERAAKELLRDRFQELPEQVQGAILTELYIAGKEAAIAEAEDQARVQRKGVDMIKALEAMKRDVERGE